LKNYSNYRPTWEKTDSEFQEERKKTRLMGIAVETGLRKKKENKETCYIMDHSLKTGLSYHR